MTRVGANRFEDSELLALARDFVRKNKTMAILSNNGPINTSGQEDIQLLKIFDGSIVRKEDVYLYEIRPPGSGF